MTKPRYEGMSDSDLFESTTIINEPTHLSENCGVCKGELKVKGAPDWINEIHKRWTERHKLCMEDQSGVTKIKEAVGG